MPVTGVDECLDNANGAFKVGLVGNLLGCQVIHACSNFVQNVILDETMQRVDTVLEVLKAVAGGVYIFGIDLIVDRASQLIEVTDVAIVIALLDTVFYL